jgi:ferrochelatase
VDYQALLVLSFGGPEGPDEVLPFLRNVTRGRGIPDERLAAVAEHYYQFGGISPINGLNRALIDDLKVDFAAHAVDLPIYFGNRNWTPYVADAVAAMRADGIERALVFATSATASYSACRQYREDMAAAKVGLATPELFKLRHYFDHPRFIAANADGVRAALAELPGAEHDRARLVFTAHSIPRAMNESSGPEGGLYLAQQRETARLVASAVRGAGAEFDLVWQSRSGPPSVPWLEPDIAEHLRALAARGESSVVVAPTGFVADHLEVRWDLDVEAREMAASLGLPFARAATAGRHPEFVTMVRELVLEEMSGTPRQHAGNLGICGLECLDYCCPPPQRGV